MPFKIKLAPGAVFAGALMMTAILSAGGSGAAAETPNFGLVDVPQTIDPQAQQAQFEDNFDRTFQEDQDNQGVSGRDDRAEPVHIDAETLAQLVAAQTRQDLAQQASLSSEQNCLAGAIYFEAKSESLEGQLAVGRVIVNRSKSGRFPASYCGVVFQPSQFSFVRGHGMPAIPRGSQDWREAVAIAKIADTNAWKSPAEGALFFHAASVSPGWHLKRMARIDNHVFYR